MQRLEAKSIHGRTYYYLSQWGWKNGKCRRLSQKYLGKLEDLAQAVQGTGPAPEYAVVLDWGLPQALWREADRAQVVEHVNQLGPKRAQGLSTGDYIRDRKSTRLNSSHSQISYAVFCLKKKKEAENHSSLEFSALECISHPPTNTRGSFLVLRRRYSPMACVSKPRPRYGAPCSRDPNTI